MNDDVHSWRVLLLVSKIPKLAFSSKMRSVVALFNVCLYME